MSFSLRLLDDEGERPAEPHQDHTPLRRVPNQKKGDDTA
jgi:hypothetical protein